MKYLILFATFVATFAMPVVDTFEELPIRNITCVKKNCGSELTVCLADSVCVENFKCASSCGDNSTCTFMCSLSYKSKAQDNLMYCMFEEHECLTLPPP